MLKSYFENHLKNENFKKINYKQTNSGARLFKCSHIQMTRRN